MESLPGDFPLHLQQQEKKPSKEKLGSPSDSFLRILELKQTLIAFSSFHFSVVPPRPEKESGNKCFTLACYLD